MNFTKEKIKGMGTYGVIHEGEIRYRDGRKERGCLKTISHYNNVAGIGNLREVQILQTLSRGCIHFPKILGILFDEYTEKPNDPNIRKTEYLNFVTELMDYSGENFFGKATYNINDMIDITGQLVSAVTYMHSKFITHRDLKPANVLISKTQNCKYLVKICDMGLSHVLSSSAKSTPGVFSPWYRPPEILFGSHKYGSNSDIWALGCTVYEILGCGVFVYVDSQENDLLFYKVLEVNPNQWTSEVHDLYKKSSNISIKINGSNDSVTLPPGEQLLPKFRRSSYFRERDIQIWQMFESFLKKCFNYNFNERSSGWSLMNESLFNPVRSHIDAIKAEITKVRVHEVIEFHIPKEVNDRKVDTIEKFFRKANGRVPIRQLFHATDLANKILCHSSFVEESKEVEKVVSLCLYIFNKYFAIMVPSDDPIHFFDCLDLTQTEALKDLYKWIYSFELKLIKEMFPRFNIMRPGIYEMSEEYGQFLTNEIALLIFRKFARMTDWGGGNTYRSLYRKLYHENVDPNYVFIPLSQSVIAKAVV